MLQAINKLVLLKPIAKIREKETAGGIIIENKNPWSKGEVVSVGDKCESVIKVGDTCVYIDGYGTPIEDFISIQEDNVSYLELEVDVNS